MKSGQLKDIAIVYKTLYFLSQAKPLSFREKKMLEKPANLSSASLPLLLSVARKNRPET